MATITLYDETTLGEKSPGLTLEISTKRITARELIRQRIDREVDDYHQNQSQPFQGLVQPSDSERLLNGYKLRTARKIDQALPTLRERVQQFELAIAAFTQNRFILLVNDVQVEDLDVELELDDDSIVCFLKLIPLVGG
jgi:CDP-diacylglycerol pyrophosphatase